MSVYYPIEKEFLMEEYGMTQDPSKLIERDFIHAKAYLLTASDQSGMNLYDHLTGVVKRLLEGASEKVKGKPSEDASEEVTKKASKGPYETFEEVSTAVKSKRFNYKLDTLLNKQPVQNDVLLAKAQNVMFKRQYHKELKAREAAIDEPEVANYQYLGYLLEQANIGMNREEMVRIWLSIKQLAAVTVGCVKVRFWGKLFGTKKNYYVAEVEWAKDAMLEKMESKEEEVASTHTLINILPSAMLQHTPAEQADPYFLDPKVLPDLMSKELLQHTNGGAGGNQAKMAGGGDGGEGNDDREKDDWERRKRTKEEEEEEEQRRKGWMNKALGVLRPPLPEPFHVKEPLTPPEKARRGANRKTYFVCTAPGLPWKRLPHVTPQQINVAKQIKKFLTGDLEASIVSNPMFPGKEKNYLRAQIARISAGTHISPLGFYVAEENEEEEEEEEEEDGGGEGVEEDPDYEALSVPELTDPSLENWVHHVPYILDQGRVKWADPTAALREVKQQYRQHRKEVQKMLKDIEKEEKLQKQLELKKSKKSKKGLGAGEEGEEEEEEEEEEAEVEEEEEEEEDEDDEEDVEPEEGPALLTAISEDTELLDGQPAWNVVLSSELVPEFACAVLSSNYWPGAYAVANAKTFENLYVGWGHKYTGEHYTPPELFPLRFEYNYQEVDPEKEDEEEEEEEPEKDMDLQEVDDPTVEQEDAWWKAHKPQVDEDEEEEEDDEEEENEEEEDDNDDDLLSGGGNEQ